MVLIKSQAKKHKFQNTYEGPFRVVDVFDSYIEIMKNGKRTKIHKNLTKKSNAKHDREPPIQTQIINLDDPDEQTIAKINLIYNINIKKKN